MNPPIPKGKTDVTGKRFGKLMALRFDRQEGRLSYWLCSCDCGNQVTVRTYSLLCGRTRSCGCLGAEVARNRLTTHGESKKSKEYEIWRAMRRRCGNPNAKNYRNYGGRGISVCERWDSYECFLADMGRCPEGFSIERKNNDGNYEPSNCIWADPFTQTRNKRVNRIIEFQGVKLILKDWSKKIGISPQTIGHRLKAGWSIEKALTTSSQSWKKSSKFNQSGANSLARL